MARHIARVLAGATLALLLTAIAQAEGKINTNDSAYAVSGYDVVAYFTENEPVKGKPAFSHSYKGATWLFASAEHRDSFAKSPEKFAPRYDGYCAYGVSNGYLVKIDPRAFTIRGGRLYLNYSLDVRSKWLGEVEPRIKKADQVFPTLAH